MIQEKSCDSSWPCLQPDILANHIYDALIRDCVLVIINDVRIKDFRFVASKVCKGLPSRKCACVVTSRDHFIAVQQGGNDDWTTHHLKRYPDKDIEEMIMRRVLGSDRSAMSSEVWPSAFAFPMQGNRMKRG
jgi:hypothetical protein